MFKFADFCRLCLTQEDKLLNILISEQDDDTLTVHEKLLFLNPNLIPDNDNLPKWICTQCKNSLNIAYSLMKKSVESLNVLNQLINQIKPPLGQTESTYYITNIKNIADKYKNNESQNEILHNIKCEPEQEQLENHTATTIEQEFGLIQNIKEEPMDIEVEEQTEFVGSQLLNNDEVESLPNPVLLKIRDIRSINADIDTPQLEEVKEEVDETTQHKSKYNLRRRKRKGSKYKRLSYGKYWYREKCGTAVNNIKFDDDYDDGDADYIAEEEEEQEEIEMKNYVDETSQTKDLKSPFFPCDICGKWFDSCNSLVTHHTWHKTQNDLTSSNVNNASLSKKKVQTTKNATQIQFKCNYCENDTFSTLKDLIAHTQKHFPNSVTVTSSKLKNEIIPNSNNVEIPLPSTSNSEGVLLVPPSIKITEISGKKVKRSKQSNSDEESLLEPRASTSTTTNASIQYLLKPRPSCWVCSKSFPSIKELNFHRALLQHEIKPDTKLITTKNEYKCGFCSKHFLSSKLLSQHLKTHVGFIETEIYRKQMAAKNKPNYTCKVCGKIFEQYKPYLEHKVNHEEEYLLEKKIKSDFVQSLIEGKRTVVKMLKCHCGQTFCTSNKLKLHQRIHLTQAKK